VAQGTRLTAVVCITIACASPLGAQTRMSLQEAIERAVARNPEVAIQRDSVALANAAAERAEGAYDLFLRVDGRGRVRTDPINSILSGAPPGALAPRTTTILGTASMSQLFSSGATLQAGAGLSRDTSNSRLALLTPSVLTSFNVDFRQPLLQGRHIDQTRRALRLAAVDRTRSAAALTRTMADAVAAVERAYWSLVAALRDVAIRRRAVTLAEQQQADTKARIEGGVAPESDLAAPMAEVARRRGDVYAAEESARRVEHALKALILDAVDDPLWSQRFEPTDPPEAPARTPDPDAAIAQAIASRPELAEARAAIARQDVEIEVARDRVRPALDLVAGYALRGLAGGENEDAFPIGGIPIVVPPALLGNVLDAYENLFTHRFADASVGVTYSVPVGNRTAKADVAIAEIGRRQAQTVLAQTAQRIGADVRNALVGLETAAQRIEVAKASIEAAGIQLRAEQDRFDAGLTTNFFVLTRQNDLAQAELAEATAQADYRKAFAEYLRATGTLLAERNIVIETPPSTADRH
jgi:HAE1 family hydrophobic/amphiphilic exporter-1